MTVQTTYAFTRPVPYLIIRGQTETLDAPVRYGATGDLVAPSSGTWELLDAADDTHSSGAVTVASSIATADVSVDADEPVGSGWTMVWTLTFATVGEVVYRQSAYIVDYRPPNVISAADLYTRIPQLRTRVPQAQSARGTDVGWQPQIDEAYYELIQWMLGEAREPWRVREVTGYRRWLLVRSLQLCVEAIAYGSDDTWSTHAKNLWHEMRRASADLRLQMDDESPDVRRAGRSVVRLAPLRRSRWQ